MCITDKQSTIEIAAVWVLVRVTKLYKHTVYTTAKIAMTCIYSYVVFMVFVNIVARGENVMHMSCLSDIQVSLGSVGRRAIVNICYICTGHVTFVSVYTRILHLKWGMHAPRTNQQHCIIRLGLQIIPVYSHSQ